MDLQQEFLERLLQGNDVSDEVRTCYTDQINEIEDQLGCGSFPSGSDAEGFSCKTRQEEGT